MPSIPSGKRNHWVAFQSQQEVQDPDTGEMVVDWVTVCSLWTQIAPLSAREFRDAQAQQSEVRGYMVIPYRSDVDAKMRAVYRGKFYNILGVMEDAESGREHLTLSTGQGVNLGG